MSPRLLLTVCCWSARFLLAGQSYETQEGTISFASDAPLENVSASSDNMRGLITPSDGRFIFSVELTSFGGFNSALQREHFNENYLESPLYPKAQFSGRIIEPVDFSKSQSVDVRAKGILDIHGVRKERIIPVTLKISPEKVVVVSRFSIRNADHAIAIPKIVNRKVAELVSVEVQATLLRAP